jgi:hypothetical protein
MRNTPSLLMGSGLRREANKLLQATTGTSLIIPSEFGS